MANGIDIVIGADVRGALTGLQQVEQRSKQVASSVGNASKGFNTFTTSSNQATLALSNLGRVAQDAPFGFIGIANNLNPLLESFQRLKATTGTTGGALKALGSSLLGPGGIGIALSVASSLLIVFGDKLFGASKKAKEASEETKKYNEAVKSAISSIAEESAKVQVLINYIKLESTSRVERVNAIKELQRIAPSYFATLNAETATIGQVTAAYNLYVSSLRRVIEAKVLEKQLTEVIEKRLSLQKTLNKPLEEEIIINGKLVKVRNAIYDKDGEIQKREEDIVRLRNTELLLSDKLAKLKPPLVTAKDFNPKEVNIKPDKITIDRPALGSIKIELPTVLDPEKIDKSKIAAAVDRLEEALNKEFSLVGKELRLNLSADVLLNQKNILAIQEATKGMSLEVAQGFRKNVLFFLGKGLGISGAIVEAMEIDKARVAINQLISQLAVDSISSLAEGLGNALAGGNLSNGFKAFADIIANGFMAIGKQMIAAAPIIAALKEAIRTLNPAVLLPAGIALVAIGAALRGSLSSVRGSRASGGPVAAGVPYEVGEAGREIFVPSVSGTIVPNNRIGGYRGGGSQSTGRSRTYIRGNNLVLAMARTNRSQVRLG